jgi:hypothetical protein
MKIDSQYAGFVATRASMYKIMTHQQQRRYATKPLATTSKSEQSIKARPKWHLDELERTTVPRPNVQDMNARVGTIDT